MLFIFLIFTAVLCVLFFKWYPKYRRAWKYYNQIPGPKPMFLIGNALDFPGREDAVQKFMKWTKEFGPIVKMYAGPETIYLVTHVKLAELVLTSQTFIEKGDMYKFIMPWLGTGLLTSTGEKWKTRRKIITPTFHFKILEQFIEVFHSNTDTFIQQLKKEVGKSSFNVYPYVTMCALDIICETAMGVKINAQTLPDSDYVKSVKTILLIMVDRTFSFAKQFDSYFYFTQAYKDQKRALKVLHGFTDSVIKSRKAELLRTKKDDTREDDVGVRKKMAFLDLLLQASANGQPLSDLDIREEVDTFMFEGHDTTSSALSFALYTIANHPQVQSKILEEQDAMFNGNRENKATYAELQEMRYLEMVIKETLRMYPSVVLMGRQIKEDTKFGDYTFLKGGVLAIFLYGLMNDPENFPNPEKFDPERFAPENTTDRNIFSYVPFSAGPRNCIGQKFAMLEMKSFLSSVLRRYEFSPAIPHQELQLVLEGLLNSDNGFPVRIRDRL